MDKNGKRRSFHVMTHEMPSMKLIIEFIVQNVKSYLRNQIHNQMIAEEIRTNGVR